MESWEDFRKILRNLVIPRDTYRRSDNFYNFRTCES